ncbi:MAG: hydrolase [Gaiellaceae bacterium]|nr:hydrolase [Gaiellaceae bacterium]
MIAMREGTARAYGVGGGAVLQTGGWRARSPPAACSSAGCLREAEEETGLVARLDRKLGDVRYVYTRRGSGERVFKVVSFYLLRYRSGRIGEIRPEMEVEVEEARWLLLEQGPRLLAYGGERDMARQAALALADEAL